MRLTPSGWQAMRDLARDLGFLDLGAVPADALPKARWEGLREWLDQGLHGEMAYMAGHVAAREDPRVAWPGARSVIVGLVPYDAPGEPGVPGGTEGGTRGSVSRYAWGRDYHLVVKRLLMALGRRLQREVPGSDWRTFVDRGTALEKPLAALAGLGWVGKHGNLLRTDASSWFFIGALMTDVEIASDAALATEHCGTCTACIEACPTQAIVAPQRVDARRCISYLTIEIRGAADRDLRSRQGSWLHGCDACQDACPWNRHRMRTGHPRFAEGPLGRAPLLTDVLRMDDAAFMAATPKSAIKREGRRGLVRNAIVAAGNSGDDALEPELTALLDDPEPLLRAHAAWALGRLGGRAARAALERARHDPDARVREEAEAAMGERA